MASLQGQGSAVTSIVALDQSFGKMLVYASQDKALRICKGQSNLSMHDYPQMLPPLLDDGQLNTNMYDNYLKNHAFEYEENLPFDNQQFVD